MTLGARIAGTMLVLLLLALQHKVWFSDVGYFAAQRLSAEVEAQRNRAELMAQRNDILTSEVLALQHGVEALEARARVDLGMIKKDETFYVVADPPVMGHPGDIHNPRAFSRLDCSARFKVEPGDFQVTEQLGFEPGAVGEHLYLQIEKVASETLDVAERLAVFYGVSAADIGFAGFKDKRAVTRQWFSIRTVSDLAPAAADRLRVVARGRYHKKLRRGAHAGNDFVVHLRDVRGAGWQARLSAVQARGVPNYFGPQRFAAGALARARAWLLSRGRRPGGLRGGRGWYLSVLRSDLFNTVLSRRVQAANWDRLIDGDVAACVDECGAVPTGPLWGRGRSLASGDAAEVERCALVGYADICHGLEFAGLQQDRRPLILRPRGLQWRAFGEDVQLRFGLDRGGYATSLLREVFMLEPMSDADFRIGFAGAARGV